MIRFSRRFATQVNPTAEMKRRAVYPHLELQSGYDSWAAAVPSLSAKARSVTLRGSKGVAGLSPKAEMRRLRAEGQVPAVIFGGKGSEAGVGEPITVRCAELEAFIKYEGFAGRRYNLTFGDGADAKQVLVEPKQVRRDPVSMVPTSITFYRIVE